MRFSGQRFSYIPTSSSDDNNSVLPVFDSLINDPDAEVAFLLEAFPYDDVAASLTEVDFSQNLLSPILNLSAYPARLGTAVNSQVNLFSDEITGSGSSSFGVVGLFIGDEENDNLLNYFWDGRFVRVMMGRPSYAYTEYEEVFRGISKDIEHDDSKASIVMRDKSELLDVDIQTNLYAGFGGVTGNADLKDAPKPLLYGIGRNIKPVLAERALLMYQFHDGAAKSVLGAYDGGVELQFAGDYPSPYSVGTVAPGYYITSLATGFIRLGAEPEKELTIDAEGDVNSALASGSYLASSIEVLSSGFSFAAGYVLTTADIIRSIVLNKTTLSADDIELQSISRTNIDSARVGIGLYLRNGGNVRNIITKLMEGIGGSYAFNRLGKLTLAVQKFGDIAGEINYNDIVKFKRVAASMPSWKRTLKYQPAWEVQGQKDVLAGASTARKDFVSNEYRYAASEDPTVLIEHPLARTAEFETYIDDGADAEEEVARQQRLFGTLRQRYNLTVRRNQFKYKAGDTITLNHNRFGFPKTALILSIAENSDKRFTDMRVWV